MFLLNTKYDTNKIQLEKEITDVTDFAKKKNKAH